MSKLPELGIVINDQLDMYSYMVVQISENEYNVDLRGRCE